ncbi:MucR family transcriptional regulator (plasmid) [Aureimonas ureilytica]|uniref:MucR family transcriptional regulator n=1 Tax=Aureimonas ureilytica TaxID=401562 RepID=UPI003CF94206
MSETDHAEALEQTVEIVSAYVSNSHVPREDLVRLIGDVFAALRSVGSAKVEEAAPAQPLVPAVPIRKSITPDHIICLEDGKSFKSLKRHLYTKYGLTPEEYRAKWGLPSDYPMVAANYAAKRSELAKSIGLGRKGID